MPSPTGVVSGPLMLTTYFLRASTVASGSHSPVAAKAFSPARISSQSMERADR